MQLPGLVPCETLLRAPPQHCLRLRGLAVLRSEQCGLAGLARYVSTAQHPWGFPLQRYFSSLSRSPLGSPSPLSIESSRFYRRCRPSDARLRMQQRSAFARHGARLALPPRICALRPFWPSGALLRGPGFRGRPEMTMLRVPKHTHGLANKSTSHSGRPLAARRSELRHVAASRSLGACESCTRAATPHGASVTQPTSYPVVQVS